MERQADTVSCGVYCMMIADCLVHNIDLSLLNRSTIVSCRDRIAQALLEQAIPAITVLSEDNSSVLVCAQEDSKFTTMPCADTNNNDLRATELVYISPLANDQLHSSPPLLHSTYDWNPTVECISSSFTLHAPILSEYERHSPIETCLNQPQPLYIAG